MSPEVSRIYLKQEDVHELVKNTNNTNNFNQNQINHARVFINSRTAMLELLEDNINFLEIGVAAGDTSEFLCKNKKVVNTYLLDPYNHIDFYGLRDSSEPRYTPKTHSAFVYKRISPLVSGEVIILEGTSEELLPISNLELDYIFIDGNHSYESVKLDLENSVKMLKTNGIIGVDDYINYIVETDQSSISEYGVMRAVNEFLKDNHDFCLIGYAFSAISPTVFIQRFPVV
jgi:hypothetical protein